MNARPIISCIIMMGDSLSDRGTMYDEKLFGIIPMSLLSGLQGKSPGDSFTNGFPWSDHFIAALANEFTIKKIKKEKYFDSTDIADALITQDSHIKPLIDQYYNLKDDSFVDYDGVNFVRNYTVGGLSAHNYKWAPTINIGRFVTRLILPTLNEEYNKLIEYDKENYLSAEHKAKTLVIEWSGANDLITVNEKPSKLEANKAVRDRIANMEKLIKQGYSNFVLFNLPDLSLTPRFQAKSDDERENARICSENFNKKLALACEKMRHKYPACNIQLFDADKEFQDMFYHPEKYNLEMSKRNQPYTKSDEFKIKKDSTSPADGYMFWDDVHPTADVHAYLASKFLDTYSDVFDFVAPDLHKKEMDEGESYPSMNRNNFFRHAIRRKANDDFYVDLSAGKNKLI